MRIFFFCVVCFVCILPTAHAEGQTQDAYSAWKHELSTRGVDEDGKKLANLTIYECLFGMQEPELRASLGIGASDSIADAMSPKQQELVRQAYLTAVEFMRSRDAQGSAACEAACCDASNFVARREMENRVWTRARTTSEGLWLEAGDCILPAMVKLSVYQYKGGVCKVHVPVPDDPLPCKTGRFRIRFLDSSEPLFWKFDAVITEAVCNEAPAIGVPKGE